MKLQGLVLVVMVMVAGRAWGQLPAVVDTKSRVEATELQDTTWWVKLTDAKQKPYKWQ